ncbi:MAG: hypothetical protein O3B86_19260, partial [Planctomycetota bacterium]|nr:hypothetical protein [Planctomycetota bacterium]
MIIRCFSVIVLISLFTTQIGAAEPSFDKDIQPYLTRHCIRCHDAKKQEGEFRLDALSKHVGVTDTSSWAEVRERISSGEMPPENVKDRP